MTDAIVVGGRCAGSAAAIALAHAGREVVVLDRARFPADTLSTHLLFAGGVAELEALGARERVEALGPPRLPLAHVGAHGLGVTAGYSPIGGIDYALCVRRPGLDAALRETARAAGAELREGVRVTGLVREGGRVAGVRLSEGEDESELRAPLVIGADGRRSTVARLVGAEKPYREQANGRACYFAYFEEGRPEWNGIAAQWRAGGELGTAFPCDGGRVLVLLMPARDRAGAFRDDLQGEYERTIEMLPELAERLRGCRQESKVRGAADLPSYFRRSAGAGWALAGDAGHFKDPVTAQGIRDALRYGRRLGEAAAPVLDDVGPLDLELRGWELERDRACLETYQWTNLLARAGELTALEAELYRDMDGRPDRGRELLDVFARSRRPSQVLTVRRSLRWSARALSRAGADRAGVARLAARELRTDLGNRAERGRLLLALWRFRISRGRSASASAG